MVGDGLAENRWLVGLTGARGLAGGTTAAGGRNAPTLNGDRSLNISTDPPAPSMPPPRPDAIAGLDAEASAKDGLGAVGVVGASADGGAAPGAVDIPSGCGSRGAYCGAIGTAGIGCGTLTKPGGWHATV